MSVAVGLAIGVTPLYGLHLILVVSICVPLRLDARIAYLAANVSLPFIAPFLSFAEIQIGSWLQTGHGVSLDVEEIRARGPMAFVGDLVAGTAILAPMAAVVGGALTFGVATLLSARSKTRTPLDDAIRAVAARYPRRGPSIQVKAKLASDPVTLAVTDLGAMGDVVDVGCGRGQLALVLVEMEKADHIFGLDWDAAKLAQAREAARAAGAHASFEECDVRTCDVPACDTVMLIDVLHYMSDDEQDALLARTIAAARTRIVVRDLDPDRGWRSIMTRVQEAVTTTLRFNHGAQIRVRPIASITGPLEAAGFTVTVSPCWQGTPFANVLVVGQR